MSTQSNNSPTRFQHDAKLLMQFVRQDSQEAFAELMRLHLPFVYATCRRELGDAELARDAAQVVFVILARKAATVRSGTVLAAWLFRTARFVSHDLRKRERRRMLTEQSLVTEAGRSEQNPEAPWDRVTPLLNETLAALSRVDRDAILLRYFEGRTLRETGAALGLSENAARMRVGRALEKMRRHLGKAGITFSTATLASLLEESRARALSEVPQMLTALVEKQAGRVALHTLKSSRAVYPAQKVETAMKWAIWKSTAVVALSAVVVFGGGTAILSRIRSSKPAAANAGSKAAIPADRGVSAWLRYRFRSRDTRGIDTIKEQKITQTVEGREIVTRHTLGVGYRVQVTGVDVNGNADIRVTFTSVLWKYEGPQGTLQFDSIAGPVDLPTATLDLGAMSDPTLLNYYLVLRFGPKGERAFAALLGQAVTAKIAPDGSVLGVDGTTAFQEKLLSRLTLPEGSGERMETALRNQFSDQAIKEALEQAMAFYPRHAVKIGDAWTRNTEIEHGTKLAIDNTYTLLNRAEGIATVAVAAACKSATMAASTETGAVRLRWDLSGREDGTMEIQESTGWIRRSKLTEKLTGKMVVEGDQAAAPLTVPVIFESAVRTNTTE